MSFEFIKTHRRSLSVALSVVLFILAVVVFYFATYEDDVQAACAPEWSKTGITDPLDQPFDSLVLEEFGTKVLYGYEAIGPHKPVSFGFVLLNSSNYVLKDAVINVRLVDEDGVDISERMDSDFGDGHRSALSGLRIPLVMPGSEVGMGGYVETKEGEFLNDDGKWISPDPLDYDKISVEFDVVSGEWWNIENDEMQFAEAKIGNINAGNRVDDLVDSVDGDSYGFTSVGYNVTFSECYPFKSVLDVSAISRDKEGQIIGGSSMYDQSARDWVYRPGTNEIPHASSLLAPDDFSIELFLGGYSTRSMQS